MKVAIFDYKVTKNNPAGLCHLNILRELAWEHEFTVFAVEFENPFPERIKFIRIPVPMRPLALLFIFYHLLAPIIYLLYTRRNKIKFDLIQLVECNLSFGDVSYAHFCHKAYLKRHWSNVGNKGVRGIFRWLNYWLHSLMEPYIFKNVKQIVVPSSGLKRYIEQTYPGTVGKIAVIPNSVEFDLKVVSNEFSRETFRSQFGLSSSDTVLLFVALGNFEHKGLRLIINSIRRIKSDRLKLWVVGGNKDLLMEWRSYAEKSGVGDKVFFFGMQTNVSQYYSSADVFVLPSAYETFPLVALQAAAAGLPLIVTRLFGVDEFMIDGNTGYVIDRSESELEDAIKRILMLSSDEREAMSRSVMRAVEMYSIHENGEKWRNFYSSFSFQESMD